MNTRLFAALFIALFVIGAFPIFFMQPFGSASAGIMAGFMLPLESFNQIALLLIIGLISAWIGKEVILALPLGTLLMLVVGLLTQVHMQAYPAVHYFILGAVILFALSVNMLRRKSLIFAVLPISVWAYICGSTSMQDLPAITTPFFFMIGIILSNALILAIGVALGITLADNARASFERLKKSSATFASFLSLF